MLYVDEAFIGPVRCWVEKLVVGLNLCPFARRELVNRHLRFIVSDARSEEALLTDLDAELSLLDREPDVETTLIIHPRVLQDFHDYNQFLDRADALLEQGGRVGIYQLASFHPDYRFAGTRPQDAENYTNRSPYPLLHLLREASLAKAIDRYPDTRDIPERNIALMNELGEERLRSLLNACLGH